MPDLIPVENNPFNINLVPVEGNPFALQGDVGAAIQQQNAAEAQRRATISNLFHSTVGAPGTVAQPVVPQTPGMWSDEDEARRQATEAAAADWAPQQALNSIGSGMPMAERVGLGMAGGGIKAFHGSPHDFEAFDLSKIGTGEGAQAYGHGLYFAEHPETAQSYKEALTNPFNRSQIAYDNFVKIYGRTPSADELSNATANLPTSGKMYEVNINADPEHFLDWDKPLSEQHPKVQQVLEQGGFQIPRPPSLTAIPDPAIRGIVRKALRQNEGQADNLGLMIDNDAGLYNSAQQHARNHGRDLNSEDVRAGDYVTEMAKPYLDALHASQTQTPAEIMQRAHRNEMFAGDLIGKDRATPAELTQELANRGIPGIKYLDQGSRGTENGTSNYVVFNDKLIDIIKKYGLAGLVAGGASHFTTTPVDHNPFAAQQ